jgi:hypothetical protein
MAIAPLFQRFVDDELELAPALVSRVLAGTVQLLGPSKEPAPAGGERIHYADLVTALQRGSAIYEKAFVDSLRGQVSGGSTRSATLRTPSRRAADSS